MISGTLGKFHKAVVAAGIPIDGVSDFGSGPIITRYTIQFRLEATQAQRQDAEQLKAAFDWRPRRLKEPGDLRAEVKALNQVDLNKLTDADKIERLVERLFIEPDFGRRHGVSIEGDEVNPIA